MPKALGSAQKNLGEVECHCGAQVQNETTSLSFLGGTLLGQLESSVKAGAHYAPDLAVTIWRDEQHEDCGRSSPAERITKSLCILGRWREE